MAEPAPIGEKSATPRMSKGNLDVRCLECGAVCSPCEERERQILQLEAQLQEQKLDTIKLESKVAQLTEDKLFGESSSIEEIARRNFDRQE